ncbi:P-loop NTPase [Candidatus Bathyarchaeota archaeon]|nr:P-loop NTPase [Candidatus Bathyarchaeota archaeon]
MKVAVSGKGGVGKTLIAAGLAYNFARKGLKTIAIDADPSPNLGLTLGLSPEEAGKIIPISENKELVESKTSTGVPGVYRLTFTVDDIIQEYSVNTPLGVNLIVMGTVRSMGSGCTCPANAVVRSLLRHLVVKRSEAVIIDLEAGVEHMGRGTAQHVDHMLVIVNANIKSFETAKRIYELGVQSGMKQISLVGNKVENVAQREAIEKFAEGLGLEVLEFIPYDPKVLDAEMRGETPLKQDNSEALKAIERLSNRLLQRNV